MDLSGPLDLLVVHREGLPHDECLGLPLAHQGGDTVPIRLVVAAAKRHEGRGRSSDGLADRDNDHARTEVKAE